MIFLNRLNKLVPRLHEVPILTRAIITVIGTHYRGCLATARREIAMLASARIEAVKLDLSIK